MSVDSQSALHADIAVMSPGGMSWMSNQTGCHEGKRAARCDSMTIHRDCRNLINAVRQRDNVYVVDITATSDHVHPHRTCDEKVGSYDRLVIRK